MNKVFSLVNCFLVNTGGLRHVNCYFPGCRYVLFCLFSGDDPVMVALKCLFFPLVHKKKKGKTHFGITSSLRSLPFCIAVLSIAGYK